MYTIIKKAQDRLLLLGLGLRHRPALRHRLSLSAGPRPRRLLQRRSEVEQRFAELLRVGVAASLCGSGQQGVGRQARSLLPALGNEVVPATGNVFYSHSYMFLYAYPFTHTGGLATWTPNDQLSLVSGVVQGWDTFFDSGDKANFMTGATFTSSDKHTSLAFNAITGQEQEVGFTGPEANRTAYSLA